MDIYVAVFDQAESTVSAIVGAFSTEDKARAACQAEEDEDAEVTGMPAIRLAWTYNIANMPDGSAYTWFRANLNHRS